MISSIILGGGCFWCLEAIYSQVKGVKRVLPGYAGGDYKNPKYEDLHKYSTGHAEVVQIEFDTEVISLEKILEIFWYVHDPTTINRQGNDVGPEYRSIILYNSNQLKTVKDSLKRAIKLWEDPIVTEIKPLTDFYPAEEYHKDFYIKNPNNGYCQIIINPKLAKFRKNFKELLE